MVHAVESVGRTNAEFALAFETSTAIGCVALGRGDEILATRRLSRPRSHAVEFLPAIEAVCRGADVGPVQIGEVYVSSGPGSFTGLRIGITAARMIAFATGARLVAVPTLEIIAQNAAEHDPRPAEVAVLLDAKRGHVYTAAFIYQSGRYVPTTPATEADPLAFLSAQSPQLAVLGEGVLYHRAAVQASGRVILPETLFPPRAETVYRLGRSRALRGEFVSPREFVPTYIRPPEAEEVWARKQAQNT